MKKRILIIIYALLLCVTVSFAWLSNFQVTKVNELAVDYRKGGLTVANLGFEGHIEIPDGNGGYKPLYEKKPSENATETETEILSIVDKVQMVPDSITPFRIKIKNLSTTEYRKAKLGIAISLDPEELRQANVLEVLYLDIISIDGFSEGTTYHSYIRLDEAYPVGAEGSGEYFYYIYGEGEELMIPPTSAKQEYVTFDCSFYYDKEATAEYQNKSIKALSFRLE